MERLNELGDIVEIVVGAIALFRFSVDMKGEKSVKYIYTYICGYIKDI